MEGQEGLVQVHLLGLPVQARVRFSQHLQELTRELSLIHIGAQRSSESSLPLRLLQIAAEMDTTYAAFRAAPDAVVDAAMAAGEEFCDVTYTVPPRASAFVQGLGQVLEEVDDFCRSDAHLLSLPAPEEVVAYRRWFVAESVRQTAGQTPRPWRPSPSQPSPSSRTHAHLAAAVRAAVPAQGIAAPAGESGAAEVGDRVSRTLVMESMASSVATARRHVREALRRMDAEELEESAELGVSELVTNAVLHARTVFTLTVRAVAGGRIRIEVRDSSVSAIQPRHFSMTSTTGRGLQLVESISWDWGVEVLPSAQGPGKVVWFEPRELDALPEFAAQDWAVDFDALS